MSVYTSVDAKNLQSLLQGYTVGQLQHFVGISDGIENTNYFVDTSDSNGQQQRFVLTLFESLDAAELPYFLNLTAHLAEQGLPCAHPIADRHGNYLQTVCNKPAALVQRLPGKSVRATTKLHCQQAGTALARLHLAGESFTAKRKNPRDFNWCLQTAAKVQRHLTTSAATLLATELEFQQQAVYGDLPAGTIHADLFHDNALFVDDQLTGIIDFYYACDDYWLYDLAITVNDWCINPNQQLDQSKTAILLQAYHAQRPLQAAEQKSWSGMLRLAALRFWLSRQYDQCFPRPGSLTHSKDPERFASLLAYHQQTTAPWVA